MNIKEELANTLNPWLADEVVNIITSFIDKKIDYYDGKLQKCNKSLGECTDEYHKQWEYFIAAFKELRREIND